jgi:hypothetical protein
MRPAALIVAGAGFLALAPCSGWAQGATEQAPAASASKPPAPAARPHRKLKLGPFADPYARIDDASLAELLRFYQHIEVEGQAPQELEMAMAAWWDHFNFQHAIYGRGYNIQTPTHPGAVNILPLIDWLKKKVKDNRRNKKAAEAAEIIESAEDN